LCQITVRGVSGQTAPAVHGEPRDPANKPPGALEPLPPRTGAALGRGTALRTGVPAPAAHEAA